MTDKELQKLGRRELLQLLLDQAKEAEQLRAELTAANERAREMDETFQRLRERLDEKDAHIREMGETYDRLRERLNDKDAQIQELNDTLQAEREAHISALTESAPKRHPSRKKRMENRRKFVFSFGWEKPDQ